MWNKLNSRNISMAICCVMLAAACGPGRASRSSASNEMTEQIEFTTLARGQYSGIEEKKYAIVTSREEWEKLWEKLHKFTAPLPDLPVIDFTSEIVLGVFLGTRPTGGYSIEIYELRACDDRIRAFVKSQAPEPEDMVTTALTQPYHIVSLKATGKEIEFKEK